MKGYPVMTNKEQAQSNKRFNSLCVGAGVTPTARQYSKWQLGFGRVYKYEKGIALSASKR